MLQKLLNLSQGKEGKGREIKSNRILGACLSNLLGARGRVRSLMYSVHTAPSTKRC